MNIFIQGVFFSILVQALGILQKAYEFGSRSLDDSKEPPSLSFAASKFMVSTEFTLCGSIFINTLNSHQSFFQVLYENNSPWFGLYIQHQKATSSDHLFFNLNGATGSTVYEVETKFLEWNHACIGELDLQFPFCLPHVQIHLSQAHGWVAYRTLVSAPVPFGLILVLNCGLEQVRARPRGLGKELCKRPGP